VLSGNGTEERYMDRRVRTLYNEGLRNLYCSQNSVRATAVWRIMWARRVELMNGQGDLDSDGQII